MGNGKELDPEEQHDAQRYDVRAKLMTCRLQEERKQQTKIASDRLAVGVGALRIVMPTSSATCSIRDSFDGSICPQGIALRSTPTSSASCPINSLVAD